MLEKHNITKLLEYERYCRDTMRFDAQKECYAEKSRVRITWYDGDGREFVERSRKMSEQGSRKDGTYSSPRHKIYNTFVWLNGGKAVAEMQCMMGAYHRHTVQTSLVNRATQGALLPLMHTTACATDRTF